jgi:hypothetical protein
VIDVNICDLVPSGQLEAEDERNDDDGNPIFGFVPMPNENSKFTTYVPANADRERKRTVSSISIEHTAATVGQSLPCPPVPIDTQNFAKIIFQVLRTGMQQKPPAVTRILRKTNATVRSPVLDV